MTHPEDTTTVRITLRDVYEMLTVVRDSVATLSNNELHVAQWRAETDTDLRDVQRQLAGTVSRREFYGALTSGAAVVAAVSPFLAQLYGGA